MKAAIVGSIRPEIELSESLEFVGTVRTLDLEDQSGVLLMRVSWVSGQYDNRLLKEVAQLGAILQGKA